MWRTRTAVLWKEDIVVVLDARDAATAADYGYHYDIWHVYVCMCNTMCMALAITLHYRACVLC